MPHGVAKGMKSDPLRHHPTAFATYDFVVEFPAITAFGILGRMLLSRAIGRVKRCFTFPSSK
jgi:hypothetical protein